MANINSAQDTMWTDWLTNSFDDVFVVGELVYPTVNIKAFVRTPAFTPEYAEVFAGLASLEDLAGRPEWVAARSTPVFTSDDGLAYLKKTAPGATPISVIAGGTERAYIEDGIGWTFTNEDGVQEIVTAVVFYLEGNSAGVDNPIVFATTRGCGVSTVVHENSLVGVSQSYVGLGNDADLLTVSNVNEDGLNPSTFAARHVLLSPGLPPWESAHSQHLWIEPQRVNLIANPAFHAVDTEDEEEYVVGWRCSPSLTCSRVSGGIDTWRDEAYCLEVSGTPYDKNLESNFFPNISEWYSGSFSISVSAPASVRCGLVAFDPTYTRPRYVVSNTFSLKSVGSQEQGFLRIEFLTKMFPDAVDLCFRVEVDGSGAFWVSNILIDPHPGQYEYFDGACTRGAPGDFRWMGGETDRHFSLWYNNYQNTKSRLVGGYDSTDLVYKKGLVEEWAPTGATILAHWDAVTPTTPQNWSGNAYYTLSEVYRSEPTTGFDEYNFDLSVRRETGYIPYMLDSDDLDNPGVHRLILDDIEDADNPGVSDPDYPGSPLL